ncbi:MAG TPA: ABC transporter permease [Acidimicrobiales bacterium]
MARVLARRVLTSIPALLGVMLVALLLLELMPGDPAEIMAGENATPEAVQMIRDDLRLDDPLYERFSRYVGGVVTGDLGESPGSGIPVWDRISEALPVTLSLGGMALVLAVVVAIPAGTWAALRRDGLADRAVAAAAAVLQAVPPFVIGLGLVIFLAVERAWLPANGYVAFADDPYEWFRHLILPATALALSAAAELARQTRGAVVDVLEQDYIRAARAKGLRDRLVIGKHVAKNAATPVVTVLGLQVGRILGGAVVVELIFGMHGFGALALNAVVTRDIVLIQGVVLVSAIAVLIANLLVDLVYVYLNPRSRA